MVVPGSASGNCCLGVALACADRPDVGADDDAQVVWSFRDGLARHGWIAVSPPRFHLIVIGIACGRVDLVGGGLRCIGSTRRTGSLCCRGDGETDQLARAREGRTRPLVAPAAGTGELRRRRVWRRLQRSALSPLWRRPDVASTSDSAGLGGAGATIITLCVIAHLLCGVNGADHPGFEMRSIAICISLQPRCLLRASG